MKEYAQYQRKPFGKDYMGIQISQRHYRLNYNPTSDNSVALTAGTDTTTFTVPFTFQFLRAEFTHINATNVLVTTEYESYMQRGTGSVLNIPLACTAYWTKKNITETRAFVDFTDTELVFEGGTHTLIFIGTSTDKIIPLIYIKEIK